jgi:peptide/nickel transport system substrate-binding protein
LAEAGWVDTDGDGIREKDGQTLDVLLWASPGLGPLSISEFIQSEANQVGFNVTLESFEYGIMRGKLAEGIPNVVVMQFNTPDPDTVYSSWLWPGKSPFSRWQNDEFAAMGEEARRLNDVEEAAKLYRAMSIMAIEEAVVVPIYTTRYAVATTRNVQNVVLPPSGWNFLVTLNDAYIQE